MATNVTYVGCALEPANVPISEEDARALLPEGFTPAPFQGIPGTGTGVLFALRCASAGTGLVEDVDVVELGAYLAVEPPETLRAEGVTGYRFLLSHVVGSDALLASYAAMGHLASAGDAQATFTRSGTATTVEASARSEPLSFTMRSALTDVGPADAVTLRFFEERDGVVAGGLDFSLSDAAISAGEASYSVDSGAPPFGSASAGPAAGFLYEWPADALSITITPFRLGNVTGTP